MLELDISWNFKFSHWSFNSYNLIKLNFILPNQASIEQHNILVTLSVNKYKNKSSWPINRKTMLKNQIKKKKNWGIKVKKGLGQKKKIHLWESTVFS